MGFTIRDQDTLGQQPSEYSVQLDASLTGTKLGPGKDAGAQVDSSGINDFDLRGLRWL